MRNQEDEKLDLLLITRRYHELSEKEKNWVDGEVGGEASYKRMRQLLLAIQSDITVPTDLSVKRSLINKMKIMHQPIWARVVRYRMPSYTVAICSAIIGVLLFFTFPRKEIIVEKPVLAEVNPAPVVVTEYMTDTVFVERIIKVPVYQQVKAPLKGHGDGRQEITDQESTGHETTDLPIRSLAQQTELRNLLVRSE